MESSERFFPSSSEVLGDKDATKKALSQLHSWEFRAFPPTFLNFSLSVASCFPLQLFGIRALRNSFSEEYKSSPENVKDFFFEVLLCFPNPRKQPLLFKLDLFCFKSPSFLNFLLFSVAASDLQAVQPSFHTSAANPPLLAPDPSRFKENETTELYLHQ